MYEKLSKLFFNFSQTEYNIEYEKRFNSYGSYKTNLKIKGFRKGQFTKDEFELFYVNIPSLMNLNNEVLINSSKIKSLVHLLPDFVTKPYFDKLIINEAQSNNIKFTKTDTNQLDNYIYRHDNGQGVLLDSGTLEPVSCQFGIDSFKNEKTADFKIIYILKY